MTYGKAKKLRALIEQLSAELDDNAASEAAELFPMWDAAGKYTVGDRVQYDGTLYKCLAAHTAQSTWTPTGAPSLWAQVLPGQDGTPIGEWVQPGSTNPYHKGDRVTYGGKTWESTIDNNVWAPGVYGWSEVT